MSSTVSSLSALLLLSAGFSHAGLLHSGRSHPTTTPTWFVNPSTESLQVPLHGHSNELRAVDQTHTDPTLPSFLSVSIDPPIIGPINTLEGCQDIGCPPVCQHLEKPWANWHCWKGNWGDRECDGDYVDRNNRECEDRKEECDAKGCTAFDHSDDLTVLPVIRGVSQSGSPVSQDSDKECTEQKSTGHSKSCPTIPFTTVNDQDPFVQLMVRSPQSAIPTMPDPASVHQQQCAFCAVPCESVRVKDESDPACQTEPKNPFCYEQAVASFQRLCLLFKSVCEQQSGCLTDGQ